MIKDCSCNLIKTLLNRWGTWITAGLYYSRNYEEVKNIVLNWDGDGLIVKNAKNAISSETLTQSLVLLQQYAKVPELITKIEGDKVSIVTCHQIISDFILELQSDDPTRTYLVNRLENMQDLMDHALPDFRLRRLQNYEAHLARRRQLNDPSANSENCLPKTATSMLRT